MKGIKEAFIDAGEISRMLGIGMTKAYAIIKEYNAELEAKGYFKYVFSQSSYPVLYLFRIFNSCLS